MECEFCDGYSFMFTVPNPSGVNKIHITMNVGDDADNDVNRSYCVKNLTRFQLETFRDNFLNEKPGRIVFSDGICNVEIQSNVETVDFDQRSINPSIYHSALWDVPRDVCKDAVLECIDAHLYEFDRVENEKKAKEILNELRNRIKVKVSNGEATITLPPIKDDVKDIKTVSVKTC